MMNFEKYTNSSKKIINSAQNLALGKKHQKIAPIHIMSELLNSNHEIIIKIFEKINIDNIKKDDIFDYNLELKNLDILFKKIENDN